MGFRYVATYNAYNIGDVRSGRREKYKLANNMAIINAIDRLKQYQFHLFTCELQVVGFFWILTPAFQTLGLGVHSKMFDVTSCQWEFKKT